MTLVQASTCTDHVSDPSAFSHCAVCERKSCAALHEVPAKVAAARMAIATSGETDTVIRFSSRALTVVSCADVNKQDREDSKPNDDANLAVFGILRSSSTRHLARSRGVGTVVAAAAPQPAYTQQEAVMQNEDQDLDGGAFAERTDDVQDDVQSALADIESGEIAGDDAAQRQRLRDERGRFAAREGVDPAVAETEPAMRAVRAPDYWKPDLGDFGRLPPQVQNAILTREAQIHKFASEAGRRLKVWEPLEQAVAGEFQARGGQSLPQYLTSLAGVENHIYHDAMSGQPKFEALDWLARSYYGKDLASLVAARGQTPQVDPALEQLSHRLAQIEQDQSARARQEQEMRRHTALNEFETFAKDKPLARDPAMMQIMQRLLSSQEAVTFEDAYEKASWIHPPAREALQREQRQAAVRRARSAAVSPRAAAPSPGAARAGFRQTIEEDVRAALDELS
jgi:hypothetical protein